MERSKKLVILVCVFAAICGVTFGVTRYEEYKENIKNSDKIIASIDKDSVTALSWKTETGSLSFKKEDGWIYDDDGEFPVDEEKINALLDLFTEFGTSFCIEDVTDYSQYGLGDPVCSIEITTEQAGTHTYKILLGDYSKMDSQRYVSIEDGNVYLVPTDPYEQFNVQLKDMIKNDEIPSFKKIEGIQFEGDTEYNIVREEENGDSYNADDVYFTKIKNVSRPLDNSLVENYTDNISSLVLDKYATYNATKDELASYGLDTPDLTVTVDYSGDDGKETENSTFTLHISRVTKGKKKDSGTAYARIGDSQIVYELPDSDYEELMKSSYNDLRHQKLFYGDFDNIYQFDFTLEGKTYTITSEEDSDGRTYYYDGGKLDIADIRSTINSLTSKEFTSKNAEGKEEVRIKLYIKNEKYPEIEIVLYRYDGDKCLAVVDGESVAMVSRTATVDFIESVNAVILKN